MSFDPKAAQNQSVLQFMKNARALVVDSAAVTRGASRTLLANLGVSSMQIKAVESLEQAMPLMESHKPNLVITEVQSGAKSAFDLLAVFRKLYPSRLQGIFILVSSKASPIISSVAFDAEVDALVIKPFTIAMLETCIIDAARMKGARPRYLVSLENARIESSQENYDSALRMVEDAIGQDPKPYLAYAEMGRLFKIKGSVAMAEKAFEVGLTYHPSHYHCLMGLFDIYFEQKRYADAFQVVIKVRASGAFPMNRVAEFIFVAAQNQKVDEILNYLDLIQEFENPDERFIDSATGALVACSKTLLETGFKDKALEILKRTQTYGRARSKCQVDLLAVLNSLGMQAEFDQFFRRLSEEVRLSKEIRTLEVNVALDHQDLDMAMKVGELLVRQEGKDYPTYLRLMETYLKKNGVSTYIDAFADKVARVLPARRDEIEQLIKKYKAQKK